MIRVNYSFSSTTTSLTDLEHFYRDFSPSVTPQDALSHFGDCRISCITLYMPHHMRWTEVRMAPQILHLFAFVSVSHVLNTHTGECSF